MTQKLVRIVLAALVVGMAGVSVSAEEAAPRPARPLSPSALERLVQESSRDPQGIRLSQTPSPEARRRKDSILDGALIGAAIGGVGGSALMVAATGGSDDIPKAMLNVAALPAIGGFVAGMFIDKLR